MTALQSLRPKDFATATAAWWCPGCGDYGVLASLKSALAELAIIRKIVLRLGHRLLGEDRRLSALLRVSRRARARAAGCDRPQARESKGLTVIAAGGDGDGYAIGAGHFIHAVRRNPDLTYIVMDNQTYGLTKGQSSPTSDRRLRHRHESRRKPRCAAQRSGRRARSGRNVLARGFSANPKSSSICMKAAIAHRGFSVVEVMSPCVTFNKRNTYAWFKENVYDLAARDDYAPHDRRAAFEVLTREGAIPLGIIYREERPTFEERCNLAATPIAQLDLRSSSRDYAAIAAAYGA